MNQEQLTNQFLIAMPNMVNPMFYKTIIYICEHNEQGAIGIIVNKPLDIHLDYLLSSIGIKQIDKNSLKESLIYYGGPLQQDRGFIIHSLTETPYRSSLITGKDIAVTTSQDILEATAIGKGPENILVALGYTAWAPEQLEYELAQNLWFNCPADSDTLFKTPPEQRLQVAAGKIGVDINNLLSDAGHA